MVRRYDDALGFVRTLLYSVEAINSSNSILIGRFALQLLEQLAAAWASTAREKINSFRGEKCSDFLGAPFVCLGFLMVHVAFMKD